MAVGKEILPPSKHVFLRICIFHFAASAAAKKAGAINMIWPNGNWNTFSFAFFVNETRKIVVSSSKHSLKELVLLCPIRQQIFLRPYFLVLSKIYFWSLWGSLPSSFTFWESTFSNGTISQKYPTRIAQKIQPILSVSRSHSRIYENIADSEFRQLPFNARFWMQHQIDL